MKLLEVDLLRKSVQQQNYNPIYMLEYIRVLEIFILVTNPDITIQISLHLKKNNLIAGQFHSFRAV